MDVCRVRSRLEVADARVVDGYARCRRPCRSDVREVGPTAQDHSQNLESRRALLPTRLELTEIHFLSDKLFMGMTVVPTPIGFANVGDCRVRICVFRLESCNWRVFGFNCYGLRTCFVGETHDVLGHELPQSLGSQSLHEFHALCPRNNASAASAENRSLCL
jgi:hypothetical protein